MLKKLRALCVAALTLVLALNIEAAPARAQAVILPPGKTCFQATTGISGMLAVLGTITAGSAGTSGTYANVALTGGSGSGGAANITVSGGGVTQVVIVNPGVQYQPNDVLSASSGNIGGVTGFSVVVNSITINSSLAGGQVGMYIPGTLTPKQTWQDSGQLTQNTNPVSLNQNGCALIYGIGSYRQILYDSLGDEVWDQLTQVPPVNPFWAGQAGGTANAITLTDASFSGADGQAINFLATASNTGPTTITPSGTATAYNVVKNTSNGPVPLTGGEIIGGSPGNLESVVFSSVYNEFFLQSQLAPSQPIDASQFGVDPTYTNDSTLAFTNFWQACMTTATGKGGNFCTIGPGHYKVGGTGNLLWDLSLNPAGGWTISCGGNGAGRASSAGTGALLDFTANSGTGLELMSSVASATLTSGRLINCGIINSAQNQPALQLGRNDLSDALNAFEFDSDYIDNLASAQPGIGLKLNEVLETAFTNIVADAGCADAFGNCPSGGYGLELDQASFNIFNTGSFSSGQIGLHITNGFNFGNVWTAPDLEVNFADVVNDSASSSYNTIIGGQYVWYGTGNTSCMVRQDAAFTSLLIENPNISGTSVSSILTLGAITGGGSGTPGTYTGVNLTGGNGAGAVATIVVGGGGNVTSVSLSANGEGYRVGDVLSAASASIGSTIGFSVPVATIYCGWIGGSTFGGVALTGLVQTVITPTFPASTVTLPNVQGRRVSFTMVGSISQYCIGPTAGTCFTVSTNNIPINGSLRPEDKISVTYTGTPAWVWLDAQ